MLNLSDKELDRLSREAASEHDPGDIVGPKSWDKLEVRLDRHLGHVTPHVGRGFYRLPFYYAPVVLLLVGATWYFTRNHRAQKVASSGSPPLTLVKPAPTGAGKPSTSSQNPIQTDKSTSTLAFPPATVEQPTAPAAAGAGSRHDLTASGSATSPASATTAAGSSSAAGKTSGTGSPSAAPATGHSTPGSSTAGSPTTGTISGLPNHSAVASNIGRTPGRPPATRSSNTPGAHLPRHNGHDRSTTPSSGSNSTTGLSTASDASTDRPDNASALSGTTPPSAGTTPPSAGATPSSGERQLSLSAVRGPVPTKRPGSVSDSALRAFTVKAIPTPIQRKGGLYVNKSLQIGVLAAPDFSSVNSMSGDKPGSTIGLTADYQFAHHWYVGSGLLLSRKNYAAAPQDFHPPNGFYTQNDMTQNGMPDVDFVKGSFTMLEIPLNLRYDFSVTGNTLFFATAGLSSYLMTSENCNYYYHWFNRPMIQSKQYGNHPNYLFSALDLSMGVEMGVSNTLSVLVAPYVKVPVRNIGFGQVALSSVGINFILEFTPVLSRKR
jgi:hypothetical protein